MIQPNIVVHLQSQAQAAFPPGEFVRPVPRPVVKRMAPVLPVLGKVIRRHARASQRPAILLQQEKLPVGPNIRAARAGVNRQVANQAHTVFIGILPQLAPLLPKAKLPLPGRFHPLGILPPQLGQIRRFAVALRRRPFLPGLFRQFRRFANRRKQGPIIQPIALLLAELLISQQMLRSHPAASQSQGLCGQLLLPGKHRKRRVRGVAFTHRVQRQQLPKLLPGHRQIIHKTTARRRPTALRGRQGAQRAKHAGRPLRLPLLRRAAAEQPHLTGKTRQGLQQTNLPGHHRFPAREQLQRPARAIRHRQFQAHRLLSPVADHQNFFIPIAPGRLTGLLLLRLSPKTAAGINLRGQSQRPKSPVRQQRIFLTQISQPLIPAQQLRIFPPPRIRAAVKGIGQTLRASLVAVVNAGYSQHRKLQQREQLQPLQALGPLFRAQGKFLRRLPARRCIPVKNGQASRAATQHRQNAGGVVGANQIQIAGQSLRRIVLQLANKPLRQLLRPNLPQQPSLRPILKRIVHHAVQLVAKQIAAVLAVALLVAGVLPNLAQHQRVRHFCLSGRRQPGNEKVRQLVGHIQPPTAGP